MNISSKKLIFTLALSISLLSSVFAEGSKTRRRVAQSLLVPGWGQLAEGNNTGYAFLVSELLLISGYYYCDKEVDIQRDKAYRYAIAYAHVNPGNYSEQYFDDVARYDHYGMSSGGYNEAVVRRIQSNPNLTDEEKQQEIQKQIYSDEYAWSWDSDDHQAKYKIYRKDAKLYEDHVKVLGGVIFANHLISGLHSLITNRRNSPVDVSVNLDREFTPRLVANYRF
jgi:hypothetical protein